MIGLQSARHDRPVRYVELANLLHPEGRDAIENCFVRFPTFKVQVLESRKDQGKEQRYC